MTGLAGLLFALIIPSAPYWAFGFPAAIVVVFGADLVQPAGALFIAKVSLKNEQSMAQALFQTLSNVSLPNFLFDNFALTLSFGKSSGLHLDLQSQPSSMMRFCTNKRI